MNAETGNIVNILVCNGKADLNKQLSDALGESHYRLDFIESTTEAIKKILAQCYDVVILELDMDAGVETISIINQIDSDVPIITITGLDSLETQRQVRKGKIFYYLVKPIADEEIKSVIEYAVTHHGRQ